MLVLKCNIVQKLILVNNHEGHILPITPFFPYVPLGEDIFTVANDGAETTLASAATSFDATITVLDASSFAVPCIVSAGNELMLAIVKLGNTLTVQRGFQNTTPASHIVGTAVVCNITAYHFNRMHTEITAGLNWLRERTLSGVKTKQNLLKYSSDFINPAWVKIGSPVLVSTGLSPIQTMATVLSAPASGSGILSIKQNIVLNGKSILCVYAKHSVAGFPYISVGHNTAVTPNFSAWFDIQNGIVGTMGSSAKGAMVRLNSGWYRCIVEINFTGVASFEIQGCTTNGINTNTFSGQTVNLWGAQIQNGDLITADMGHVETLDASITLYSNDSFVYDDGLI